MSFDHIALEKERDALNRQFRSYSWLSMSRSAIAVMEFIEENMAKLKRPPLAWDGRKDKPLLFIWGLYYKGDLIPTVIAYNIEERWYIWQTALDSNKCSDVSFCVKRLS